jgi:pimeloyl-ACP methyl ester carboxylesterase
MAAHADDVGALLRHVDARDVTVLGYSAMASAAAMAAVRQPDRVGRVVMVDGGPAPDPAARPERPRPDPTAHVVGRLGRRYPSVDAYLDTWRQAPGVASCWNPYVERLLADELTGDAPDLHQSLRVDAVVADAASHLDDGDVRGAYGALAVPVTAVRASRDLLDEPRPVFPDELVDEWRELIPQLHDVLVPDVNHYSILFTERGARAVADALRQPTTT